jgi:hypothetical protein
MKSTTAVLKILKFLVVFLIGGIGVQAIHAQDISWYTGNQESNSFEISTANQLKGLADLVNNNVAIFTGKTIMLTADITLTGNWVPIGSGSTRSFTGTFDGKGYTILGLFVSDVQYAGLFGYVGTGGQIKNVNVIASKVKTRRTETNYAGALAAYYASDKAIEHSSVVADSIVALTSTAGTDASKNAVYAGAFVGYADVVFKISSSYARANVSSSRTDGYYVNTYSGGLVGYAKAGGTIEDSYVTGNVHAYAAGSAYSGGLIGYTNSTATIKNSYVSGGVSASGTYTFYGPNYSGGYMYTYGSAYSGGLIGRSATTNIFCSYTTGNVVAGANGSNDSGGLIGYANAATTIENSYASGNISGSGTAYSGGLIGNSYTSSAATIKNSYVSGGVSASSSDGHSGGIFGWYSSGTITYVYYNSEGASKAAGSGSPSGISGKSSAELKKQETFQSWDFDDIWGIEEDENYPYLLLIPSKKSGAIVAPPTLASRTHASITINPVIPPINGQVVEYAIDFVNTAPVAESAWRSTLTFADLNSTTDYYIFARTRENYYYETGPVSQALSVKTDSPSTIIAPFTETFESELDRWFFANDGINKWTIGTDTKYAGSYSAYISNNDLKNEYTITSASIVHLYRYVEFPESESDFVLSYYFKGMGQASQDYMTIKHGSINSALSASTVFSGTCLDSIRGLSSWTQRTVNLPATTFSGKTIKLVFSWVNDNSIGTQPPAAIDDIKILIRGVTASVPTVASITHHSITINAVSTPNGQEVEYTINTANDVPASATWQKSLVFENLGFDTNYYIFARTIENEEYEAGTVSTALSTKTNRLPDAIVPFIETFEDDADGWLLVNGTEKNQWMIGTSTKYAGSYSAYISNNGSANAYTTLFASEVHLYRDIIFPESDSNFILTFYFKGRGEYSYAYMTVCYSDTDSKPVAGFTSNCTRLGSYQDISNWTQRTITLPTSTFSGKNIRLVFSWINTSSFNGSQPPAAIDNVSIYVSGTTPPSGNSTTSSSSSAILSSSSITMSSSSSTMLSSSSITPSSSSNTNVSSSSNGTIPIRFHKIATGPITVQTTSNSIILENLPNNAKVEVYNLQGKQVYSTTSHSPTSHLKIGVQAKGIYVMKINNSILSVPVM